MLISYSITPFSPVGIVSAPPIPQFLPCLRTFVLVIPLPRILFPSLFASPFRSQGKCHLPIKALFDLQSKLWSCCSPLLQHPLLFLYITYYSLLLYICWCLCCLIPVSPTTYKLHAIQDRVDFAHSWPGPCLSHAQHAWGAQQCWLLECMCHNSSSCVYHSWLHYCCISWTFPSFLIFRYSKQAWCLKYYWKEREGVGPTTLRPPIQPSPLGLHTSPCLKPSLALWLATTWTLWAIWSWPRRRTPLHLLPINRRVAVGQITLPILPLLLFPCKPTAQDSMEGSNFLQGLGLSIELAV